MSQEQHFALQNTYMKSISMESPNTPHIFHRDERDADGNPVMPASQISIQIDAQDLGEGHVEVVLMFNVINRFGDKPEDLVYDLKINYAGIFQIVGFDEATVSEILNVNCPNVLYPYVRAQAQLATSLGGYMPIILEPIDFMEMFEQNMAAQQSN